MTPARHERPASPCAARASETPAIAARRRAGPHAHAAKRPPAGTFSRGAAEVPSGQLRRATPVSQTWRGVAIVAIARRTCRCVGRGNDDVADRHRAQVAEAGRRGARGAAGAKSTQVGLTVSGHPGPDDANLAPRVAVRQWLCGSRSRVRHLGANRGIENRFQPHSHRRAGVAEIDGSAHGDIRRSPQNRSRVPGFRVLSRGPGSRSFQRLDRPCRSHSSRARFDCCACCWPCSSRRRRSPPSPASRR